MERPVRNHSYKFDKFETLVNSIKRPSLNGFQDYDFPVFTFQQDDNRSGNESFRLEIIRIEGQGFRSEHKSRTLFGLIRQFKVCFSIRFLRSALRIPLVSEGCPPNHAESHANLSNRDDRS